MKILPILTIFTGSFLLFLVQPMFARLILPRFGSSAAVWVTCLASYEALLVAGYAWGAALAGGGRRSRDAGRRWLVGAHVALLVAAAAWVARLAARGPVVIESENAWVGVLATVCVCIAAPYVLLSAGSTLVQALASSKKGAFWLYGVSNLGSFCGLLAFPLALEPHWSVQEQLFAFAVALVAYAAMVFCLARVGKAGAEGRIGEEAAAGDGRPPAGAQGGAGALRQGAWLAIPAVSSALLAATTTFVCADVSPMPLLWVVFLGIFLLSYTVGFNAIAQKALPVLGLAAAFALFPLAGLVEAATDFDMTSLELLVKVKRVGVASYGIVLTFLHAWLFSLRPGRSLMGRYYLFNAIGGAAGGVFAGIVAPQIFDRVLEYPCALCAAMALVGVWATGAAAPWARGVWRKEAADETAVRPPVCAALTLFLLACTAKIAPGIFGSEAKGALKHRRDFYGALTVVANQKFGDGEGMMLLNGRTRHGLQIAKPARDRLAPTTYYGETGGGMAVKAWRTKHGGKALRFASVGLGAGTMAAWAEEGDTFVFYEISPAVVRMASDPALFTFLGDCKGALEIRQGDGRRLLEKEEATGEEPWDILEIDAFSGDAIPLQLLSDEAFDLYLRRLAPDGILAVHASNWQFDLMPVMKRQMERHGLAAVATMGPMSARRYLDATLWTFFTRQAAAATGTATAAAVGAAESAAGGAAETAESAAGGADTEGGAPSYGLLETLFPDIGKKRPGAAMKECDVEFGAYALHLPPGVETLPWRLVENRPPITDAKGSLLPLLTDRVKSALLGSASAKGRGK